MIDRDAALVGSSNLDYWSWNRNAELDVVATDAATVDLLAECFLVDQARSQVVTRKEMHARDWWTRFKERTAGWVEKWL